MRAAVLCSVVACVVAMGCAEPPTGPANSAGVAKADAPTGTEAADATSPPPDAAADGLNNDNADSPSVPTDSEAGDDSFADLPLDSSELDAPPDGTGTPEDADATGETAAPVDDNGPADLDAPADTAPTDTSGELADVGPVDTAPADDGKPPKIYPENCDAGHEAWVKRAISVLLGRKPTGMAEVDVVVAWVAASSRADVAAALLTLPEAKHAWAQALIDSSRVDKAGKHVNYNCYGVGLEPDYGQQMAIHIRDNSPQTALPAKLKGATMANLAHSAVLLDNLSPWYRAQVFAMVAYPAEYCQNVGAIQMDKLRRLWLGEKFVMLYENRTLGCLQCHNSSFSVTQSSDPALNKHFPLNGKFEKALFGSDTGHIEAEVFQPLRLHGVLSKSSIIEFPEVPSWPADPALAVAPWGWAPACGMFLAPADVKPSIDGAIGYLGGPLGNKASVWDLEAKLHNGITKLQQDGKSLDFPTVATDAERTLAFLLATRVVDDVWSLVYGERLVLSHGFARHAVARDQLAALTSQFLQNGWSLRTLLTAIVTHDLFNTLPPAAGCGKKGPYSLNPLLNPYSTNDEAPGAQGNSPADGLHREEAFALVRMAAKAAGWQEPPIIGPPTGVKMLNDTVGFPQPETLNELAFRIGAFLDDARPGAPEMDAVSLGLWRSVLATCQPILPDGGILAEGAYAGKDWLALLLAAAGAKPLTVLEVVRAIRDRLIAEPDVPATEVPSILGLFGAKALSDPFGSGVQAEQAARAYCGALLASPQFWLAGLAAPDQETRSAVEVTPDATLLAKCEEYSDLIVASGKLTVQCAAQSVQIVPKVP